MPAILENSAVATGLEKVSFHSNPKERLEMQNGSKVLVSGMKPLKGCEVETEELRGGAALVAAGLIAEGVTSIEGCHYIDRGYENICKDLRELGARIYRDK